MVALHGGRGMVGRSPSGGFDIGGPVRPREGGGAKAATQRRPTQHA
ncbi:MAG: hypothetical protein AAF790_08885 [Planctomycetota bacterium]